MADMRSIAKRHGNGRDPMPPSPPKQGGATSAHVQEPKNQGGHPSKGRDAKIGPSCLKTTTTGPAQTGSGTSGDAQEFRTPGTFAGSYQN